MDRVTGSLPRGAVDPHEDRVGRDAGGFEAMPAAVSPRRADRRRAVLVSAAITIVVVAGALGAAAGRTPAGADEPTSAAAEERAAPGGPPAARPVRSVAPFGQLTALGTTPAARTVIAIPGCLVTVQLATRQPRRIVECPEVLPQDLGRMLVVTRQQPLRFEVPGWAVHPDEALVRAPDETGMWTVELPSCVSRGADWLCTTWYATVDVRG